MEISSSHHPQAQSHRYSGGKRSYNEIDPPSSSSFRSNYPRGVRDGVRGRGRGRDRNGGGNGDGGEGEGGGGITSRLSDSSSGVEPDLSKYFVAPTPAVNKSTTSFYSCATGETRTMVDTPSSTAPTAGTAEKPVPVYCQKYMNNLCFLRSCDDPSDDEENDENDKSDVGAISSYHPRRTRCQFLHDAAFRRMFLARAHYTHTKYSQTHSDPPPSSVSSSHRGGRCSGRGGQHPPSTATDSDTPPVDGKLAGLKPPVAESALLRKLLSSSRSVDSSRLLQSIRFMVERNFFAKERETKRLIQQQAEEEYQRQKREEKEKERIEKEGGKAEIAITQAKE